MTKTQARKQKQQVFELLKRVNNILSSPKAWCKGVAAISRHERPCTVWDVEAVKFCLVGALNKASNDLNVPFDVGIKAQHALERIVVRRTSDSGIARYNDDRRRKFSEIKSLLKSGIDGVRRKLA